MLKLALLILGIASILFAAGCAGDRSGDIPGVAVKEATPPNTPAPTTTPAATNTPIPTLVHPVTTTPAPAPTDTPLASPTGTPIPTETPPPTAALEATAAGELSPADVLRQSRWSNGQCEGEGPVSLTNPPVALDEISYITPMGRMSGSHVTPTDHIYLNFVDPDQYHDVSVMAPGYVVKIEVLGGSGDYRIIFEHSCDFYTLYIHLVSLSPNIMEAAGELARGTSNRTRIAVAAGEVIGQAGGNNFDASVFDLTVSLSGFVVPESYQVEPWKTYTVDPFDYFVEPIKSAWIEKIPRTTAPIGGKIDYDIDGRLVGTWFLKGTGGYNSKQPQYWYNHLSFAYDPFDPGWVRVSKGGVEQGWDGSMQFGLKDNYPDPETIGANSGVTKLELMMYEYVQLSDDQRWDGMMGYPTGGLGQSLDWTRGTMLVEMLGERELKAELFLDKIPAQVTGFTDDAQFYER